VGDARSGRPRGPGPSYGLRARGTHVAWATPLITPLVLGEH